MKWKKILIWILKCWSWAVYTSTFFPIHERDGKLGFLKSLDCTSEFRFLSNWLHILSNDEDGLLVRHVVSERSQFMIKLPVFKKKILI